MALLSEVPVSIILETALSFWAGQAGDVAIFRKNTAVKTARVRKVRVSIISNLFSGSEFRVCGILQLYALFVRKPHIFLK